MEEEKKEQVSVLHFLADHLIEVYEGKSFIMSVQVDVNKKTITLIDSRLAE